MTDRVKITTPKGGIPSYVFVIAVHDLIIGSITFHNEHDLLLFKENFRQLHEHGFGSLQLDIDIETIMG